MKEIQIRLNLKCKEDGKLMSIHPPISSKKNGLMEWPLELDKWEIISIDRNSEIKISDSLDREWDVFENDEITVMGDIPKRYKVEFKKGAFGIEVTRSDFGNTLKRGVFIDSSICEYHDMKTNSEGIFGMDDKLFIPLAHLNIRGTINSIQAIILTKS